jgi:hypothetical protein
MNGDEAAARYLIECLTYLGPAFVKIGQAIASRPDIVPPLYLKYLETLQVRPPRTAKCFLFLFSFFCPVVLAMSVVLEQHIHLHLFQNTQ